jgi:hypothetical protein
VGSSITRAATTAPVWSSPVEQWPKAGAKATVAGDAGGVWPAWRPMAGCPARVAGRVVGPAVRVDPSAGRLGTGAPALAVLDGLAAHRVVSLQARAHQLPGTV